MYEDCIVKKQILALEECKILSEFFLAQSVVHPTMNGVRGYGKNRRSFFAINYQNKRTQWFDTIGKYRLLAAEAFNIANIENSPSWISMYFPPVDLPMHVDPLVKNYTRLIVLVQKPTTGGEVVVCTTEHGEKTVLSLGVGDVYLLPAHKYYHGVTFFGEGVPRVALGFDFKVES